MSELNGWELQLFDYENATLLHAFDAEEDGVSGVTWQKVRHETGSGSFTLPFDHGLEIERNQVVRCCLAGGVHFAWRIERIRHVEVTTGDDTDRRVEFSGSGLLIDWQRSVAFPARDLDSRPKVTERRFDIYAPSTDFDSTGGGWEGIEFLGDANSVPAGSTFSGMPSGWDDAQAQFYWADSGTLSLAPTGPVIARHELNFSADVSDAVLRFMGRDRVIVFFDGHMLTAEPVEDWENSHTVDIGDVSAGLHDLVLYGEKLEHAGSGPAALRWRITQGADGAVIFRSDSVTGGEVLDRPDPWPGMTAGDMIRRLWQMNPALPIGQLWSFWTLGFSVEADSWNEMWPLTQAKVRVGEDLLSVLRQFAELLCDFEPDYGDGLTLKAWVKGTRTTVSGFEIVSPYSSAGTADPDSVNVAELSWTFTDDGYDNLLVEWRDGYVRRPDELFGRGRWSFLSAGFAESEEQAAGIADHYLEQWNDGLRTATLRLVDLADGDLPGQSWDVFSVVAVPAPGDHDETVQQLVTAVTVRVDDDGYVEVVPELGDLRLSRRELLSRNVERLTEMGALGGRAASARPVERAKVLHVAKPVQPNFVVHGWQGGDKPPVGSKSGRRQLPGVGRVPWFSMTGLEGDAQSSVRVKFNDSTVIDLTLEDDESEMLAWVDGVQGDHRSYLTVEVLNSGHKALTVNAGWSAR